MNSKTLIILFLFCLSLLTGCLERIPSDLKYDEYMGNQLLQGSAPLNYKSLKKYILKPKCMSCHSGKKAKPSKDPINFDTYETTMVSRFVPLLLKGQPEKSRLFKTVNKGEMPKEGHLLPEEIEFIREWIKACAPKETLILIPEKCQPNGDNGDDDWDNVVDDFNNDDF